jgi:hypothetical protein
MSAFSTPRRPIKPTEATSSRTFAGRCVSLPPVPSSYRHLIELNQPDHYPWQPAWGKWGWPHTPLNAILSGPLVGGPWEPNDPTPRSIHADFYDQFCPQADRTVFTSTELKAPVKDADGAAVFRHMVKTIKDAPTRCVDVIGGSDDKYPQTYDLWLVGNQRVISLDEIILDTATSRLLGPSPVVASAVERNMHLFLPRGPRNANASVGVFDRMMAVHIRRGDFAPACRDRAKFASTYYNW